MSDLRWSTTFKGTTPQQDSNLTQVQPDPSTQQGDNPEQNANNYQNYLERELQSQLKTLRDKLDAICNLAYHDNGSFPLRAITTYDLPDAWPPGQMVFVMNHHAGAVPAYSDGSDWLSVIDGALISDTP